MLECVVLPDAPGELADNDLSLQVGAHVGEGILERMAHAGLRGHVDDGVDAVFPAREFINDGFIGDVAFQEGEIPVHPETLKPCVFEFGVVVCVEVIDAEDALAAFKQGV